MGGRGGQVELWFPGQLGLYSKFQGSQVTVKSCQNRKKRKERKKEKKIHAHVHIHTHTHKDLRKRASRSLPKQITLCHQWPGFGWRTSSFSWLLLVSCRWYSILHFKTLRSATEILLSYSTLFPTSFSRNLIFSFTTPSFSLVSCFILANI